VCHTKTKTKEKIKGVAAFTKIETKHAGKTTQPLQRKGLCYLSEV
jgi:hypothetical protein